MSKIRGTQTYREQFDGISHLTTISGNTETYGEQVDSISLMTKIRDTQRHTESKLIS
jgi:hypothetical protein